MFGANCLETKNPIGSMYGIFPYIWLMFMVNVGKYNHTWILWELANLQQDCYILFQLLGDFMLKKMFLESTVQGVNIPNNIMSIQD